MNIRKSFITGLLMMLTASMGFVATSASAADAGFWSYPAIQGYGPVHTWPNVIYVPNKHATYKALFDLTKPSKSDDKVSGGLTHVARAVNIFAAAGVPLDHMKFVVVAHGPATKDILSEKAYEAKFHTKNPNLQVISDLRKAGVEIVVCGNALADNKFTPAEVNPQVKVALSALSTLVILQDQGYALIRM